MTIEAQTSTAKSSGVRYEADTGFLYVFHEQGPVDKAAALSIIEDFEKYARPNEPAFILTDQRNATTITADARKAIAALPLPRGAFFAGFGASFTVRVLNSLLARGLAFLSPVVATYWSTEEEARAWLAEKRHAWLARKPNV